MNKVIFDIIHGFIEVDKITLSIIDTPEFQRLRNIKQLGAVHYVFPSANHTRFEHSLGVYYLAGELINNLKKNQPELKITDKEILLVKIAGLCHDLGHGPFSHLLDEILEEKNVENNKLIQHELRSIEILKYLVKKYNIALTNQDITLISNLIYPNNIEITKRHFLYEIVSNKRNGIDVDKFDYLKRDTFYLGMSFSLDCSRILKYARVIDDRICYLDKSYYHILEMFEIRNKLHKQVYKHKTVLGIEFNLLNLINENEILNSNDFLIPKNFCKYDDYNLINLGLYEGINKREIYKSSFELENENSIIINNDFYKKKKLKFGFRESPFNNIYFYNSNNLNNYFQINKDSLGNSQEIVYRFYKMN